MPRKSKKLLLKTDTEVAGELGTTPKVIKTARLKLESAGLVGSPKATAGNRYAYTYVAQYFSLAPHAKVEQSRMTKRQFQNDQKAILELPKGHSHINEYSEEYSEEYSTYTEAQSADMRNAQLVSDFVDHWKEAAHSDNWPVQIMAGNDDHAVEYFGPSIQKRIAAELTDATPEQLINEMRTATTELIDNQEWRTDDAQPKNIAWHFEILDLFRSGEDFKAQAKVHTSTGSGDYQTQTWEADQPKAKAVDREEALLEVLSESSTDNQSDSFIDGRTQIVDDVIEPNRIGFDTITQIVETSTTGNQADSFVGEHTQIVENEVVSPLVETITVGKTEQTEAVATETALQEENTPEPVRMDNPSGNALKTTENSIILQVAITPDQTGLLSAQGELAARHRMRNCLKNNEIAEDTMAKLKQMMVANITNLKSRGNEDADLIQ